MKPIIAYCRVLTGRQGKSGLGLDAAIPRFTEAHGFQVVGEPFVEIETGKGADALDRRPHRRPMVCGAGDWTRRLVRHPHRPHLRLSCVRHLPVPRPPHSCR
jgi:hypothetical protein